MAELRTFIDQLGIGTGSLSAGGSAPFVIDRQLVHEAQDAAGLDADFCLMAEVRGQYLLTAPSDEYFKRVTWEMTSLSEGGRVTTRTHRCGWSQKFASANRPSAVSALR